MRTNWLQFFVIGLLVHLLYFISVFQIYFKSPILNGIKKTEPINYQGADRVVFIVADGLQVDKAFHSQNENYTPFLRSIIKTNGSWGVSHTRVPTESRVGHVSLFAGTYEDVSAITRGWQDNPVDFDHVFLHTRQAYCWGSPDILRIFDKGTSKNIHSFSYDAKQIDFGEKDPSRLDMWVFNEVNKFLTRTQRTEEEEALLRKDETVFFLHLLGIDTNGHVNKPDSEQYLNNIRIVDEGIKNVTEMFTAYFGDDQRTTFIVTSDHGMTSWGAHGTGLPSETETPFIAWGAGIKKPVFTTSVNHDPQTRKWDLDSYLRTDIKQVDIATLVPFLLGLSIPVNSVGVLPIAMLDISKQVSAEALAMNAKQILRQYFKHEDNVKISSFNFKPFQFNAAENINSIHRHIRDGHYDLAIELAHRTINGTLKGITYYHQYNRLFLSLVVNLAFFMWIFLLLMKILENNTRMVKIAHPYISVVNSKLFFICYHSVLSFIFVIALITYKDLTQAVFSFLPLLLLRDVASKLLILMKNIEKIKEMLLTNTSVTIMTVCYLILIFCFIEIIVFSFFRRSYLSLVGLFLSLLPWLQRLYSTALPNLEKAFCFMWSIACVVISIFPQLPVITREENYLLVVIASFIIITNGVSYCLIVKENNTYIVSIITGFLLVNTVVKMHVILNVKNGSGLPFYDQIYSWCSLVVMPMLVSFVDKKSHARLVAVSLALFGMYLLMSISYDALFLVVLICLMALWVILEKYVFHDKKQWQTEENQLTTAHIRIAVMFTYFIFLSFFGTGNIASINSFDIASVYCFKTVFNPWVQGIVLALKVAIPFAVVIIFFRSLQKLICIPLAGCFLMILLFGDIMAVNFFFLVKDEGSWLDVGQSLSHFVITLAFICMLVPMYWLSYFVSGNIELEKIKLHQF